MAHYIVYWPQDWVRELKKTGDRGPIKVVFGSIHSRMPSIVSVKVGDVVFPVTLIKKKLYVMARLPVTHRERAFDYCMRELGREYGALIPEGIVVKKKDTFYWAKGKSFNCAEAIPDGMTLMIESDKPHTKHQEPFNCCSEWAVWGRTAVASNLGSCPMRRYLYCASVIQRARRNLSVWIRPEMCCP